MWHFRKPTEEEIRSFLATQSGHSFSYHDVGASRVAVPAGYDLDHHRIQLGRGRAAFEAATSVLRRWRMFPGSWTEIHPAQPPVQSGQVVVVLARVGGLWWMNACRIVYVIDETTPVCRFGFAYGTLPGHMESGEERFSIEWDEEDRVWYDVRAFSRPRHWLARLGYPLVRRLQHQFARDSQAEMQRAVAEISEPTRVAGGAW